MPQHTSPSLHGLGLNHVACDFPDTSGDKAWILHHAARRQVIMSWPLIYSAWAFQSDVVKLRSWFRTWRQWATLAPVLTTLALHPTSPHQRRSLSRLIPPMPPLPKPAAFDFGLQCEAEEGADQGDYGEDVWALRYVSLNRLRPPAIAGELGCA